MKFEVYNDKVGDLRVRLVATKCNTMCATEGYSSKSAATKSTEIICSANVPPQLLRDS